MTQHTSPGRALPLLLVAAPRDKHPTVMRELQDTRFTYHLVHTGRDALRDLYRYRPDLMLLGLRITDPGPWEVLRRVREISEDLRVMTMDRKYREAEALRALRAGADDLLWGDMPMPLAREMIIARLRRSLPVEPADQLIEDGYLRLDVLAREASVANAFLPLSSLEFDLLFALAYNSGQVLGTEQLLRLAWRTRPDGSPSKVKYAVLRLRRHIEQATGAEAPIETVRGIGYRYRPPGAHRS
ncbi:response regulator transcription factor [Streptomyces sp. NPDC052225]|uniref:response regulator transcription factor n=1 Tax=Streptomyces sp. NPDC052225 TaxID=3154949 RepID=UPI00342EC9B9